MTVVLWVLGALIALTLAAGLVLTVMTSAVACLYAFDDLREQLRERGQ